MSTDRLTSVLLDPANAEQIEVIGRKKAAVLVALYDSPDAGLTAVFTKRRDDLRHHAGEISFPGGRRDEQDATLVETALREAHEEVGLEPLAVRLLGALTPTPTLVTDFAVYPFVGLIEAEQRWLPAPQEVAAIVELPLQALREGSQRRTITRRGFSFETDCFVVGEHLVWGATARMLEDLFERLDRI